MKEYLQQYSNIGWVVMPIAANSKRPVIKNWSVLSSTPTDKFKDTSNLGVIMGTASGVICLDVDVKNADGVSTMEDLEQTYGALPETVMSETPSGGIHYYFKYFEGIHNRKNIGEGIDVQADGTQTLEEPSVIDDGEYAWINAPWEMDVAELPTAWKKLLSESHDEDEVSLTKPAFVAPEEVAEGGRNNTLASYVGSLLGKKRKKDTVLKKALAYNKDHCDPPLPEDEVRTVVESMIQTDIRNKKQSVEENIPAKPDEEEPQKLTWLMFDETGQPLIIEKKFAEWYVERNELYCVNGKFYTKYGAVSDDYFKNHIQNIIGGITPVNLARKVSALLEAVKNEAYTKLDPPDKYKIQFNNVALDVRDGTLKEVDRFFTIHQIPHDYDPSADCPRFKEFINNLFYEEDAKVVQEFLGYCLVPNTLAQTALFIVGEGGEGKSRITVLMQHLLGDGNVVVGDFKDLQERFSLSSLDNKMLFIDDELTLSALDETSNFKKIVTAETPMEVEVKGRPKYSTRLYSRIICAGNGAVQAKFDRSDGFYRRLLVCKVKPVSYDRPDRLLSDKLDEEIAGIINWCLEGLLRLVKNGFLIEPSEKMQTELKLIKNESDTVMLFLEDGQYLDFTYDVEDCVSVRNIYEAYAQFCADNGYVELHKSTFGKLIRKYYKTYISSKLDNKQDVERLCRVERVYINKKQVRGLVGVKLVNHDSFSIKN